MSDFKIWLNDIEFSQFAENILALVRNPKLAMISEESTNDLITDLVSGSGSEKIDLSTTPVDFAQAIKNVVMSQRDSLPKGEDPSHFADSIVHDVILDLQNPTNALTRLIGSKRQQLAHDPAKFAKEARQLILNTLRNRLVSVVRKDSGTKYVADEYSRRLKKGDFSLFPAELRDAAKAKYREMFGIPEDSPSFDPAIVGTKTPKFEEKEKLFIDFKYGDYQKRPKIVGGLQGDAHKDGSAGAGANVDVGGAGAARHAMEPDFGEEARIAEFFQKVEDIISAQIRTEKSAAKLRVLEVAQKMVRARNLKDAEGNEVFPEPSVILTGMSAKEIAAKLGVDDKDVFNARNEVLKPAMETAARAALNM